MDRPQGNPEATRTADRSMPPHQRQRPPELEARKRQPPQRSPAAIRMPPPRPADNAPSPPEPGPLYQITHIAEYSRLVAQRRRGEAGLRSFVLG